MGQPAQVKTSKPELPREKRMTLASVARGKVKDAPVRLLVYGVEGIGKSTLAAGSEAPIFLGAEDGVFHLDVAHFPQPENYQDVLDAVSVLTTDKHDYKTLVIDTLDWLEPLLWKEVCQREDVADIEALGYGKGYVKAIDLWRGVLSVLERLRRERRLHIIMLAHSQVRTWKNPEGEDFDRYTLKIHDKAAGLCKEWCDAVMFANHETVVSKDSRTKRVRGVDTGARLLYTERSAAYDAKNRYDLPAEIPLDWQELWGAIQAHEPADVQALQDAIEQTLTKLNNAALRENVAKRIKGHEGDAALLAQVNDWLNGKLLKLAKKGE